MPEEEELKEKLLELLQEDEELREKVAEQVEGDETEIDIKQKETGSEKDEDNSFSRRSFLKKVALGAAGVGAMSMLPNVSALDIQDSEGLQVYSDGTEYLDVNSGGPVEVKNSAFALANTSTDPSSNGNFRLNGSDVKIYSGGSVRNLSNVGGSGSSPLYGDGSDGSITDSSNVTREGVLYTTNYTLEGGNTLTVNSNLGFLIIFAQESIDISGTIDAVGASGNGGDAGSEFGINGGNGFFTHQQTGGAGGTGSSGGNPGGDGGDGDLTTPINHLRQLKAGDEYFITELTNNYIAAGGGGGGGGESDAVSESSGADGNPPGGGGEGPSDEGTAGAPGAGGAGGGLIALIAPSISVSGSILAGGEDGNEGDTGYGGSEGACGGGGSGGVIFLRTADLAESSPTYDVSKGIGADNDDKSGTVGGNGADGLSGEIIKYVL